MFDIIRKLLLDAKNEAISLNTVYSNCEKSGLPPNVVDEYVLYVYVNKKCTNTNRIKMPVQTMEACSLH